MIDDSIIQALSHVRDVACENYGDAIGTEKENQSFFRLTFIENFFKDIVFLDDLSENSVFYYRYGYLIIRNMLEQLMEFLYVCKNDTLTDEYLGMKIDIDFLNSKHTVVEGERKFGRDRFVDRRETIVNTAKDAGVYKTQDEGVTLYDLYSILSEKCHNSYFDSLLADFNSIRTKSKISGLNEEQITCLHTMITYVFETFN